MKNLPNPKNIGRSEDYWNVMKKTAPEKYSYIVENGYYEYKEEEIELLRKIHEMRVEMKGERGTLARFYKEAIEQHKLYSSVGSFMSSMDRAACRSLESDLHFETFLRIKRVLELYKQWQDACFGCIYKPKRVGVHYPESAKCSECKRWYADGYTRVEDE